MFVSRKDGVINGTWTMRQHEGQEELPDDHPEVVEFVRAQAEKMPAVAEGH